MSSKAKRNKRAKLKKKAANIAKASKPKETMDSKLLHQKLMKRGGSSTKGRYNIKNIKFYRDLAEEVRNESRN